MLGIIVAIIGVLALFVVAIGIVLFLGMRSKSRLVLRPVTWAIRTFINPREMKTAGSAGAYASVIRHRGRKSGRAYATPIDAVPVDDGFLIALPYGPRTNWAMNVLTSGSATIVHEGQVHAVDRPELIPMQGVVSCFSPSDQRGFRLLRVNHCLRLRNAAEG